MEQGKISVIMGIYNCADTLPSAIDSILAQTYPNWELILCDDASADNTYSVAQTYRDRYPDKIILVRNEKNSKLSFTLNHCLEHATGEYVARMDGDDLSEPDRFEKEISFLKSHPEYDLVGTAMQQFNDEGPIQVISKPENVDKYSMRTIVPFNHATILTYRSVYESLGGYTVSERTNRAQDYDLWFRFFAAGFRGHNLPEPLYLVREDMKAIKRRTFRVRWNAFKTTKMGFKLLGFPKRWLIKPFIIMLVKAVTPKWVMYLFRKKQATKKA